MTVLYRLDTNRRDKLQTDLEGLMLGGLFISSITPLNELDLTKC